MVNQQKQMQQETAYSAVVMNDHNPYPYIIFDPKGVIEQKNSDIGRDRDTYDHSLQLRYRQFLVALDLPSISPSF